MCFAFLAFVLLAGVSATSTAERNLIVNGDTVLPSDNQFFVRSWPDTVRETDDVLCGATLIHSDMIITAAHCHGGFNYGAMLYDPESESFTQFRPVDLQIAYKRYYEDIDIINYDVLVLRLETPITNIEPVLLNSDPNFPRTFGNSRTIVEGLGVGITESGHISQGLEVGYFSPMANFQCAQRLGKANVEMTDDVMCADPYTDDSICAGDSGGPLVARIAPSNEMSAVSRSPWGDGSKPVLVGVTTFGNDCLVDDIPDGFARISFFHKWINEQICNYSRDPPAECLEYFQSDQYSEFLASQDTSDIMDDKVLIKMKFQHDFMAEQTVFVFRNTATNKVEFVGPHYVPERAEYVESEFLLPVPGNYVVEIHDTRGNGLTNPRFAEMMPQGSWTISAEYSNGATIEDLASGDHKFEKLQTRFFQLPRRMKNENPTAAPTTTAAPTIKESIPRQDVDADSLEVGASSAPLTSSAWAPAVMSLLCSLFMLFQ